MKPHPCLLGAGVAGLLLSLVVADAVRAAEVRGTPPRPEPPLGLPRLAAEARPGQVSRLAPSRYLVDALAPAGAPGVRRLERAGGAVLTLDPGGAWSRPLRGSGREVTFVSFQLYASGSTIVDLAGARLGFTLSPADRSLQVMYDDSAAGILAWRPLNLHLAAGTFGGRDLAAVPTLTVRLDPAKGAWDLFSGARLVAAHLPLIAGRGNRWEFSVRAGAAGAWISGLVLAEENPLGDDTNANGIDDAFERERRGQPLPVSSSAIELAALAQAWQDAQRRRPPPALYGRRPPADRLPSPSPGF